MTEGIQSCYCNKARLIPVAVRNTTFQNSIEASSGAAAGCLLSTRSLLMPLGLWSGIQVASAFAKLLPLLELAHPSSSLIHPIATPYPVPQPATATGCDTPGVRLCIHVSCVTLGVFQTTNESPALLRATVWRFAIPTVAHMLTASQSGLSPHTRVSICSLIKLCALVTCFRAGSLLESGSRLWSGEPRAFLRTLLM